MAVDVADGIPVTFDSYPKEDGSRKTEYGKFISHNEKEIGFERVIHDHKGITSDHVIASGSYPVNFDFARIEVESYNSESASNSKQIDVKKNNKWKWQRLQSRKRDAVFLGRGSYDQYSINAVSSNA